MLDCDVQPFYSTERITELVKDVEQDLQRLLGEVQGTGSSQPGRRSTYGQQRSCDVCMLLELHLFTLPWACGLSTTSSFRGFLRRQKSHGHGKIPEHASWHGLA